MSFIQKMFMKILWHIKSIFNNIFEIYGRCQKIKKNKIVVDNFWGRGYGDNPKYIVDQLLKDSNNLDIVWLIDDINDTDFPVGIRTVKFGSPKSFYELATSHIWIDNVKANYKGKKRKGQFYLQTWHGGIAFKKIERAAEGQLDPEYVNASKADSEITDLIISDSKWVTNNISNNFWYKGPIVKTGFPRNDIFFKDNKKIKNKVQKYFNIDNNTKIILYAPTFRDHKTIYEQSLLYKIDGNAIKRACEHKFNNTYIFLERLHPNVASKVKLKENNFVKDASAYPDMQDLLVTADILITDFSSSLFDFILSKYRVFLFAKDYDEYVTRERELNFNAKKDLPFSFAGSENELIKNIESFNDSKTKESVLSLKKSLNVLEDGHASERVAKIITDIINNQK